MVIADSTRKSIALVLLLGVAAGLWFWIFSIKEGNFWIKLTISASILASSAFILTRSETRALLKIRLVDVPIGLLSAAVLYGVFYLGNIVLTAVFPSAEAGINGVYEPRTALPSLEVGALLLCLTAVAEEVFWRGFVQRLFVDKMNAPIGIAVGVVFYSGVHAWTLNGPLIVAAGVAGAIWALQFHFARRLPSVILSHAIWSTCVFLFFPLV
jgi:uncharacterized protein